MCAGEGRREVSGIHIKEHKASLESAQKMTDASNGTPSLEMRVWAIDL